MTPRREMHPKRRSTDRPRSRLRRHLGRPPHEHWLIAKVVASTVFVRAMLPIVPIRYLMKLAGNAGMKAPAVHARDRDAEKKVIPWAAAGTAKRLLRDRPCLTQALVVKYFYGRRGIPAVLKFGVNKDSGKLLAHAWVESEGDIVVGGRSSPYRYVVLQRIGSTAANIRQASEESVQPG